jgi:hypothetical protein
VRNAVQGKIPELFFILITHNGAFVVFESFSKSGRGQPAVEE